MRPVLFYTIGLPGAGKTTFARSLATWLNGVHLRGDKIGLELFRFPTFSPQEKTMVYQTMGQRAGEALTQGQHVLYDAAVNTRVHREQLAALAAKHGVQAIGLHIHTPVDLAKQRAGKVRDTGLGQPVARIIPPQLFDVLRLSFETPGRDEAVVIIHGDRPFLLQYRQLRSQLGGSPPPRLVSG